MRTSTDATAMIMQSYLIPAKGSYDTVKSTTSSIDDPYINVLEYISYRFQCQLILP